MLVWQFFILKLWSVSLEYTIVFIYSHISFFTPLCNRNAKCSLSKDKFRFYEKKMFPDQLSLTELIALSFFFFFRLKLSFWQNLPFLKHRHLLCSPCRLLLYSAGVQMKRKRLSHLKLRVAEVTLGCCWWLNLLLDPIWPNNLCHWHLYAPVLRFGDPQPQMVWWDKNMVE